MKRAITSSRRSVLLVGIFVFVVPVKMMAEGRSMVVPTTSEPLAFARYIASLQKCDPFTESGPVGILIEASLPGLYKAAELLAIRDTGENERSEYLIVRIEGDGAVVEEVIARYFALQEQMEALPLSSIAVTPANYKFRFEGEVKTGDDNAYIYDVAPRRVVPA